MDSGRSTSATKRNINSDYQHQPPPKQHYKPEPSQRPKPIAPVAGLPIVSTIDETPDYAPDYLPVVKEEVDDAQLEEVEEDFGEAQTLMDLATAYINMGDEKEAKEALNEAVEKSSGEVRNKAQRMLDSLG